MITIYILDFEGITIVKKYKNFRFFDWHITRFENLLMNVYFFLSKTIFMVSIKSCLLMRNLGIRRVILFRNYLMHKHNLNFEVLFFHNTF